MSSYSWAAPDRIPVLIALTSVVIYQTVTGTSVPAPKQVEGPVQGPPTIGVAGTQIIGAPPKGLTQFDVNLPTGILPDGGPFMGPIACGATGCWTGSWPSYAAW